MIEKRQRLAFGIQRTVKEDLIVDDEGNFGVVKECSLGRITKQEKRGTMATGIVESVEDDFYSSY
ncbi:MAG: hypothetical protein PHQ35_00420 [Phycisphaerae bacterium]|nr:hypothetical protein [Phycisphaerae bacterium]MDD5381468.1 hypothetical protein [Phycisphaerae bacterium]